MSEPTYEEAVSEASRFIDGLKEKPDGPLVNVFRPLAASLEVLLTELDRRGQEIERALDVLAPSMRSSGLEDACRQVKQAAISWEGNYETVERERDEARAEVAGLRGELAAEASAHRLDVTLYQTELFKLRAILDPSALGRDLVETTKQREEYTERLKDELKTVRAERDRAQAEALRERRIAADILSRVRGEEQARTRAAERALAVSRSWSAHWKALAKFRGWPASKHEQTRRALAAAEELQRETVAQGREQILSLHRALAAANAKLEAIKDYLRRRFTRSDWSISGYNELTEIMRRVDMLSAPDPENAPEPERETGGKK